MQISFFEEFPAKENLAKIKYVSFSTKIYLAAHSLKEFQNIGLSSSNIKEKIYWPLLQKEEGYWFSPFSNRGSIKRIFKELEHNPVPVMLDAELPTHPHPQLYFTESMNFFRNRSLIQDFIKNRKNIYTAEYFPSSKISSIFFQFLGLSFASKNHYPIKMIYSSMHDFGEEFIRAEIKKAKKLYGKRVRIALGTLSHGIKGNEPMITAKMLERDMNICKSLDIEEVILFRLGGMNKEYQKVILKFV